MSACDDVTRSLADGAPLEGAALEHARSCPACAALVQLGARPTPHGDEALPAALRAALAAEGGAVVPFSPWRAAAAPAMVAAVLVAFALLRAPRVDLAGQLGAPFVLAAVTTATLVVWGLASVIHRGERGLGFTPRQRASYAGASLALFAIAMAATTRAVPGSVVPVGAEVGAAFVHCALVGCLAAALVGAALFTAARRTSPVSPAWAGAAAGVASGLAGALFLHLACPVALVSHGVLSHGAPAVVGGALGALLGRRWLAP